MKVLNLKSTRNLVVVSLLTAIAMFSTSCGEGKSQLNIPGVDGPNLTLQQDKLNISMVFENVQLEGGLRYAIPKYNNSYIEISPDLESNGTLMSVSVDLDDVFSSQVQSLSPKSLPGGRPLPGVASGNLPAVAFNIPQWTNMSFYVGPKVFGVFIPIKNLDIGRDNIITARYYTGSSRAGNISLVGKDINGENGGFLLLLDMGTTVQKRLKSIAKRY